MVLMGVGQDQADQVVSMVGDEGRVGHDHIGPRRQVVAEGHAEVDHQPLAAISEQVQVHADLAGAAEGEEIQFVGRNLRRVGHRR